MILLGIGTDGHTASLFPGDAAVQERTRWVTAFYRQNEQLCRITLTPTVINAARCVAFLVSGADKADIMGRVVRGAQQPQRLPAQIIQPTRGEVYWLVDAPAATGSE